MDFDKIYAAYEELKENLVQKHDVIIKKNMEELNRLDEMSYVIVDKIKRFNLDDSEPNNFTDEQKQRLRSLGQEIKKLEENNEILINHSLGVINNLLSGILNIVQSDTNIYNAQGGCNVDESLDISSITEEA